MGNWNRKMDKKVIKGYTELDLKKKIKAYKDRGWTQIGEIKTENYNSGAYIALMQLNLERQSKRA
ncbi:hypothetical protein ABE042_04870 [Viridibacillus arvi]|uniref:hypothetical protein n=1 Tax=Viridibacillus arvi TaxID=263475 RepID=UPI003D2A5BEE